MKFITLSECKFDASERPPKYQSREIIVNTNYIVSVKPVNKLVSSWAYSGHCNAIVKMSNTAGEVNDTFLVEQTFEQINELLDETSIQQQNKG